MAVVEDDLVLSTSFFIWRKRFIKIVSSIRAVDQIILELFLYRSCSSRRPRKSELTSEPSWNSSLLSDRVAQIAVRVLQFLLTVGITCQRMYSRYVIALQIFRGISPLFMLNEVHFWNIERVSFRIGTLHLHIVNIQYQKGCSCDRLRHIPAFAPSSRQDCRYIKKKCSSLVSLVTVCNELCSLLTPSSLVWVKMHLHTLTALSRTAFREQAMLPRPSYNRRALFATMKSAFLVFWRVAESTLICRHC